MSYDRSARLRKAAHVRLDRFGIFQVGREQQLGALDRWVLVALSMLCDYKTGDYFGTITELAEDTGASRRALAGEANRPGVLDRLHTHDLVQIVSDFGPKVQGHLRVLALDRLVVDTPKVNRAERRDNAEPHLRSYKRGNRAATARQSRPNRAHTAPNDAVTQPLTGEDADVQGSKRGREQGDDNSRVDDAVVLERVQRELGADVIKIRRRRAS